MKVQGKIFKLLPSDFYVESLNVLGVTDGLVVEAARHLNDMNLGLLS